jgi:hypothetical protein
MLSRDGAGDLKSVCEERSDRDEPVAKVHASALELADPPGALGLDRARGSLELGEIGDQLIIGGALEVLAGELIDHGSKHSHDRDGSQAPFDVP